MHACDHSLDKQLYTFYYNTHSCHLKNTIDVYLVLVLWVNCENFSESVKTLQVGPLPYGPTV